MKVDATQTSDWGALSEVSILHETAGAGRTSICDNVWVTLFFKIFVALLFIIVIAAEMWHFVV